MKLLVGQVSPVIGDVQGNLAQCLDSVAAARRSGCTIVVLPELVLSGYPPLFAWLEPLNELIIIAGAIATGIVVYSNNRLVK